MTDTWSERVQVNRTPSRGFYDSDAIRAILDEAYYGAVGFVVDDQPFVIPMVIGRIGDTLYLHGSTGSRQVRKLADGIPVCVSVTNMRALVLARSSLNLSVNYQSAVIIGNARPVEDEAERLAALAAITDHVVPGRWADVRKPSKKELASVGILALKISEASAKVRDTPPYEEPGDEKIPLWGGLIPVVTTWGPPEPDQWVTSDIEIPDYVSAYTRPLAPSPVKVDSDARETRRAD